MFYLTETRKEGYYSTGDILFTSQTNNVDVKFTSDYSVRRSGFRLSIRSILCTDRDNFLQPDMNTATTEQYIVNTDYDVYTSGMNHGCDESAQEIQIATGQVLPGVIVTNTQNDGNYPNNACQQWNVIAGENEVDVAFQNKKHFFNLFQPLYLTFQSNEKLSFVFTVYFYVSSVLSSLLVMEVLIQSQDMTLSCLKNPIMAQVCFVTDKFMAIQIKG